MRPHIIRNMGPSRGNAPFIFQSVGVLHLCRSKAASFKTHGFSCSNTKTWPRIKRTIVTKTSCVRTKSKKGRGPDSLSLTLFSYSLSLPLSLSVQWQCIRLPKTEKKLVLVSKPTVLYRQCETTFFWFSLPSRYANWKDLRMHRVT